MGNRTTRSTRTKKGKKKKPKISGEAARKKKKFFERLHRLRKEFWFDRHEAARVEAFFSEELYHVEGELAGHKFKLERWQRQITRRIFAWKRKDNPDKKLCTRKYRVVFIFIPRKNGKSTWGAGLGLYLLFADREMGAQIVSAAADREQAAIVFETAKRMVEYNPKFSDLGGVPLRRAIPVYPTGSTYKVLSADAFSKHGKNLHGILFDELHAQPNRELVDVLKTSTGARRQPVEIYFTTAGYDRQSICFEYYDYGKRVASGDVEDESFLSVIYEADPKDDWRKEETWRKSNPNLGVSIKLDYLKREAKTAHEIPAYENTFKRLHLNMWTEQDVRMVAMHKWDAITAKVTEQKLFKRRCYAGLDLSTSDDITAFVLCFPVERGRIMVLPYFFIPEEKCVFRSRRDDRFRRWRDMGLVDVTPGNIIDYGRVKAKIKELAQKFDIREIAFDPWNSIGLTTELDGDGFTVVPFRQGYASMTSPTKEFLNYVLTEKLEHGGNEVLRWMASNVAAETDAAGNIKPSKKKSKEKIDGIVALIMGLGRLILKEAEGGSVYEERGLLSLG